MTSDDESVGGVDDHGAMARLLASYRRGGLAEVLAPRPDWALGQVIDPGLPVAAVAQPGRLLLTGATGYLGAWVLAELLARTDAELICPVRAADDVEAAGRLAAAASSWEVTDVPAERVRAYAGDLAAARLGLPDEVWAQLAESVDSIVHVGALVSHTLPYAVLRGPNVESVRTLIGLATTKTRKALHVVSSLDVLLGTRSRRPFLETFDDPAGAGPSGGYARTKWVAERLVREAIEGGLPATVVRIGSILGDGAGRPVPRTDLLVRALTATLGGGGEVLLPDDGRVLDVLPVDFVAGALVDVVLDPQAWGAPVHLLAPVRVSMSEVAGWVRSFGHPAVVGPWAAAGAPSLRAAGFPEALGPPPASMTEAALLPAAHDLECARSGRVLRGTGRDWPVFDEASLHALLDRLVGDGIIPPSPGAVPQERSGCGIGGPSLGSHQSRLYSRNRYS